MAVVEGTGACPLGKAPLEVMEMIFGQLNFPDLPAVIYASKWLKVCAYRASQCVHFLICSLLFVHQSTGVNSI
jgi:hypothetical protein